MILPFITLAVFALTQPASAQTGGALPKGNLPPAAKPVVSELKREGCTQDLVPPPGGHVWYTDGGKLMYILTPAGAAAAAPTKSGPAAVKYKLWKVDIKARRAEAVIAIDQRSEPTLLTYGDPVTAVGAIAFTGANAACFTGPATVLHIDITAKTQPVLLGKGSYAVVNTAVGRMLLDSKKNTILNMDLTSFQAKPLRQVPAGERALFFDDLKNSLVTWRDAGGKRGLVAYTDETAANPRRLAVKKGDRVIIDGDRYAVATFDVADNTVRIQELPSWSKVPTAGQFKVLLPPMYAVGNASMRLHIGSRMALVEGGSTVARQKWQRAFVYDYNTGVLLTTVIVKGSQYINYSGFDPSGKVALMEVRDRVTKQAVALKVFDVAAKKLTSIDLPNL